MRIEKARELGLCYGVRRAVDMLREAVAEMAPCKRWARWRTTGAAART